MSENKSSKTPISRSPPKTSKRVLTQTEACILRGGGATPVVRRGAQRPLRQRHEEQGLKRGRTLRKTEHLMHAQAQETQFLPCWLKYPAVIQGAP